MESTVKVMMVPHYPYGSIESNYEPLETASHGMVVACTLQFRIQLKGKSKDGLLF